MAARAFSRISRLRSYVRLTPFDTSTEAGRADERQRRLVLTAIASAVARATSIGTSLISVPLTLHYLGAERYGMWMTMSALTAMLSFADFGIGNGVLTAVARANGRDELHTIRTYVSSAFALLGAIGLMILLATAAAYHNVDWFRLFNVRSPLAQAEAAPSIAIFIACFALSLPLGIVQRVQMGMQMGFMASLWQCAASLTALCGVLLAIHARASLPWLVLAFTGAPVVVATLNSIVFFIRVRPEFGPARRSASRSHGLELARTGALFFVLQAVVAVAYTSDNVVIAQKLGAAEVAQYAVPDRLFAMASMVVALAVTPLWPAFGEALARGDHAWAKATLIKATAISATVSASICLAFTLLAPALIHFWVGDAIQPSLMLLLGLAAWRTTEATFNASSMYLNGLRAIRLQVAAAVLTAAASIVLKLYFVATYGISIMPWIATACYWLLCGVPVAIFLRSQFRAAGPRKQDA